MILNRLIPLTAQGLLISACSLIPQRPTTPAVTPWPNTFPQEEISDHIPDVGRVRYFDGLTYGDFEAHLPDDPDREEALAAIRERMSGGDPNRVDEENEAFRIAALFCTQAAPPLSSRRSLSYPQLLPFTITDEDMDLYFRVFVFPELGGEELLSWNGRRAEIRASFGFSAAEHPLANLIDVVPVYYTDRLRSLPVFDRFASVLVESVPSIRESRSLTALYPGSGSHIAPLVTALRLMDDGVIDRARFIFTELSLSHMYTLQQLLETAALRGLFQDLSRGYIFEFADDGYETTLSMTYRGHPIEILFAVNRSGDAFFREECLRQADWLILHDLAGLGRSYEALAQALIARKGFPERVQMVVMEGEEVPPVDFEILLPPSLAQTFIPGQYGHCLDTRAVGEVSDCSYRSARAFLLNDPALTAFAAQFENAEDLRHTLYVGGEPSQKGS